MSFLAGLDVSHHQADISWPAVARAGYRFAFVKCSEGYDPATRRPGYLDPDHARNVAGALRAGLVVGSYHYAHPQLSSGAEQARAFADQLTSMGAGRLPAVLDLEETGGLRPSTLRDWAVAFLTELDHLTGRRSLLYTGLDFWNRELLNLNAWPLWLAHYADAPGATGWTFWQHSSSATVPGIAGATDVNVYAGTSEQLHALAHLPPPVPQRREADPMPPTVKTGDRGPVVRNAQALLFAAGLLPYTGVDGRFGPVTREATARAQQAHKLTVSGVFDAQVWRALLELP